MVFDRVKEAITRSMEHVSENMISSQQVDLYGDLGLDSLDFHEVICAVEECFEIDLDPEVSDRVRTIADLCVLVG